MKTKASLALNKFEDRVSDCVLTGDYGTLEYYGTWVKRKICV